MRLIGSRLRGQMSLQRIKLLAIVASGALVLGAMTSAPAEPSRAKTRRVSVTSREAQTQGNSSAPAISASGRFIAFQSVAENLVGTDDNGVSDVFVRDRKTDKTRRVSISSQEVQGTGASSVPSISPNGRFIAFESVAEDLVANDDNGVSDVFVRDRAINKTSRVSNPNGGGQAAAGSFSPSVSADGRLVAFSSNDEDLVAGDDNDSADIFVRNLKSKRTRRVSVSSTGEQVSGHSFDPSISPSGRHVAFWSEAGDLVANDTNGTWDVFVHDRKTGRTRRASMPLDGDPAGGGGIGVAISADGRLVAFMSHADDLVPNDTNMSGDIFVRNLKTRKTRRVSVTSAGEEAEFIDGGSFGPSISGAGRFVSFSSYAEDLVGNDDNDSIDVFVHDRRAGRTRRVSLTRMGAQAAGDSHGASISRKGGFVAFESDAENLVKNDDNGDYDIFVRGPLR